MRFFSYGFTILKNANVTQKIFLFKIGTWVSMNAKFRADSDPLTEAQKTCSQKSYLQKKSRQVKFSSFDYFVSKLLENNFIW